MFSQWSKTFIHNTTLFEFLWKNYIDERNFMCNCSVTFGFTELPRGWYRTTNHGFHRGGPAKDRQRNQRVERKTESLQRCHPTNESWDSKVGTAGARGPGAEHGAICCTVRQTSAVFGKLSWIKPNTLRFVFDQSEITRVPTTIRCHWYSPCCWQQLDTKRHWLSPLSNKT